MDSYFIYCRKSSEQEDRQILSLPAQRKELENLAKKDNLKIVDIYEESASAHTIGRRDFNKMLARIENSEANGIIVWDESRIARNSLDGGKVIYMMDLGQIQEIRTATKTYLNTPGDKAWLNVSFTFTKKDSDDKSVNVKRGLKTKAEKGWLPSSAKPGYMNDKYAEKGSKTTPVDPERLPLIRKCWDLLLSGAYSPPKILKILNNEWGYKTPIHRKIGGKPMVRSQLYKIFHDPFYYGYFEYPIKSGIWHYGKHKTIITKEEFDKAQIILGRKMSSKPKNKEFAYGGGFITCGECGANVTAEEKWYTVCTKCKTKFASINSNQCPKCNTKIEEMINPKIRHYIYYHCTKQKNPKCTQKSIDLKDIESEFTSVLGSINISNKFKDWALKYLNEINEKEISDRNLIIKQQEKTYKDCLSELDNLLRLKISPQNADGSLLSDEEFKQKKEEIISRKNKIEESMKGTGIRAENWFSKIEKDFDLAVNAKLSFNLLSLEEKRELLWKVSSNLSLKNKKVVSLLNFPFDHIKQVLEVEPTTSITFETQNSVEKYDNLESKWSQNPSLLAALDEMRKEILGENYLESSIFED